MLGLLMKFVPAEYKGWVELAKRMTQRLDTKEEREKAAAYFLEAQQSDGMITVAEWAKFVSMLGILCGPKNNK